MIGSVSEAIFLVGCRFNSQLLVFVTRQFRSVKPCCSRSEDRREDKMVEEASACNTSMVLLNKGQDRRLNDRAALIPHGWGGSKTVSTGQEPPPVVMVDELLILNPHKLSFSEASMRIMITPHFSPRTRLSMAGRMVISEVLAKIDTHTHTHVRERELRASKRVVLQRQRLIQRKNQVDGGAEPGSNSLKRTSSCGLENGGRGPSEDAESGGNPGAQMCQAEEEEDEDGIFSPVRIPGDRAAPTNLRGDFRGFLVRARTASRAPSGGGLQQRNKC